MAAREELDADLGVRHWQIGARISVKRVDVDPGAPAWWFGDEDASQSFLNAMGVRLP